MSNAPHPLSRIQRLIEAATALEGPGSRLVVVLRAIADVQAPEQTPEISHDEYMLLADGFSSAMNGVEHVIARALRVQL